jgi:GTP-binding protein HflX
LGGEGEKEHALMKNQIKAIESKLKTMIEKERAKQEARSVDFEETRYFRSEARISLIGYTNVGKSAMMNALAGKHQVQSKDRLFETLKTTAREFNVSRNLKAVVVDTIGFIDNLPTELSKHPRLRVVDSFGGTLREIKLSDIILLMEDVSHPLMKRQREVAYRDHQGSELGGRAQREQNCNHLVKQIRVWNKIDCVDESHLASLLSQEADPSSIILTSVREGQGIDRLKAKIEARIDSLFDRRPRRLRYLYSQHEERQAWLSEYSMAELEQCNVKDLGDIKVHEAPRGAIIEFTVPLTQNMYSRYMHLFEEEEVKVQRKRDLVPEDWTHT